MEKLIELLNEYEGKELEHTIIDGEIKRRVKNFIDPDNPYEWSPVWWYKKSFGFINWLVDNNKIEPLGKFIGWETDEDEPYIKFDLVDQYIAYLSIQDNPIEFLVSILK